MDSQPLVSAVVTFYNQARFVRETLDCVLAQTYRPLEVVVVDDGSTDETGSICETYGERIVLIRQANGGVSRARTAGQTRARGSLVAFLDGDDLWAPEKIAVQVAAAHASPRAGLVAIDGTMFAGPDTVRDTLYSAPVRPLLESSGEPVVTGNCFDMLVDHRLSILATPSQVMIPAAMLREIGPWNPRFSACADYEMYLRIAARHDFALAKDKLVRYRIDPASMSGPGWKRHFTWAMETPAVLGAAVTERGRRSRLLREMAREVALAAYYRGVRDDRRWATRYMLRYAFNGGRPDLVLPHVLPYVAALWCPPGPRAWIAKAARRLPGRDAGDGRP